MLAWFPKAFTSGCTIECKSLAEHGDMIRQYKVTYFMASVDPLEKNVEFAKATSVKLGDRTCREEGSGLPDPQRSDQGHGDGVRRARCARGFANRWTFYIGKDGKIQAIDKDVSKHVATSAEDMAAKLGELGVAKK